MNRYSRQKKLHQIGDAGQEKLKNARVLVIGAGGLGCAVLPYLASAGIGTLGIIDGDKVEETNLHRQVLYTERSLKAFKVEEARDRLEAMNSSVEIEIYREFLNDRNAYEIISAYDLVVDATDSISIRYLINDACVIAGKAFVYASVFKFEGQVSVFNYRNGPTYRCLFGGKGQAVQNCEEAGVMGTTVGLIGMLQANEVIKIITGTGEPLSGKLLVYDTLKNNQHIFSFKKNKQLKIDEEFFRDHYQKEDLPEITPAEALKSKHILVDVRELHEMPQIELNNLVRLPLSELEENIHLLNKKDEIRLFCQSGIRSLKALKILKNKGFQNLKSIRGGAREISKILNDEKEEEYIH
ncbi:molybdopterin-synthase adenylyltransferase MoeB [Christiangramia crocea]|uniref:Molybdopterin-synthase adenylyltransferase n=1 Tax=Christiangramia crocea TaxID=2904124 RepID=A0A9X2A747_9FLAO|nr:molybdopterin-synthase adenylyltransferase MoeB [Gramella crocea]MCG9972914.1 molybdopterin-synthase adenylyltransferase MoeB [Gramella crocea]